MLRRPNIPDGAAVLLSPEAVDLSGRIDPEAQARAVDAVESIYDNPLFRKNRGKTDFTSLFYGLLAGAELNEGLQPTIITSLGGEESSPTIAAGFNFIPAMELARQLDGHGYLPEVIIASAGQYSIDCNGFDPDKVMDNWQSTLAIYGRILDDFYPELADRVAFTYLEPEDRDYPPEVETAIEEAALSEEGLFSAAQSRGNDVGRYVVYMASHIQGFQDFQTTPQTPFVIKVGAQSEIRFSRFQKAAIERCLPEAANTGFIPNLVRPEDRYYGQITLYYPRVGSRPPYYPETAADPEAASADMDTYQELIDMLEGETLRRYENLAKALGDTVVGPEGYLASIREVAL